MDQTNIQQVREIVQGFTDAAQAEQRVNAYLARGWLLLSVHSRGCSNGTSQSQTVYVLGHPQRNADHPEFEVEDLPEAHRRVSVPSPAGAFLWG